MTPTDETLPAGTPDGFQRLWTPHRAVYIGGEGKPATSDAHGCPFCVSPTKADADGLIFWRGTTVFGLMNLFPYNSGHILLCPYRHISLYTELTSEERDELSWATAHAMRVLSAVMKPHGFNLGMNQGAVAGAGIAAHLHQHIVPRWGGDANFFPIVAQTKAIPYLLEDTRAQLAGAWESVDDDAPLTLPTV